MAGKPFIMMGLIKVWGVFKKSDKYPFHGMKQKNQKFNIKGHISSQSWPIF